MATTKASTQGVFQTALMNYLVSQARTVEGSQVHGHTRLELVWTVIPVIILAVIGTVVFLELPKISSAPAAANPLRITVEGHQYYWQFDYPNGARSIGTLHVPVGEVSVRQVRGSLAWTMNSGPASEIQSIIRPAQRETMRPEPT